jgi:HD-like signal output (HDOD) protein
MDPDLYNKIEKIISRIEQLPTLPAVYHRLQDMLSDPKVSAKDVGGVIEKDPALAAKILKMVNSSYYGFPKRISTISHSVVILGFTELMHLALSVSILRMFNKKGTNQAFNYMEFWKHSLGVAVCAGVIGRKVGPGKCTSHEEAFVAGLLHDVGKILEEQYIHREFTRVLELKEKENLLLFEAENRLLGITHQDVGSFLAEKWRLPSVLEAAIGLHHDPRGKRNSPGLYSMASIIHCADVFVRGLGIGSGGDPFVPPLFSECWHELGLTAGQVDTVLDETVRMYSDVAALLLKE